MTKRARGWGLFQRLATLTGIPETYSGLEDVENIPKVCPSMVKDL